LRLLLAAVIVPILGAFLLPLLGKLSPKLRNFSALFLALVPLVSVLLLIYRGQTITINFPLPLGANFALTADGLALFMAAVSSFISAIIVFYSFDYISHYDNQNEYYLMVLLFLGSMMGLVFSANLILLYIFWEMTALSSWRLIGFFREKYQILKADKSFLVTVTGALLMLAGFIMVYQQAGSFDLAVVRGQALPGLAILFILAGILSKSATLPFQTWLPDAGVAPSPVTALLHAAVLVKIGVYVFARLFVVTWPLPIDWQVLVMWIALVSALVSAGAALIDKDLKRIIAYSTVSQIGFIFLGLASGTAIGVAGALLYILMHGLAKGGLFLCAGIVEQNAKTKRIDELGGLAKTMPWTAFAFLFCSFSIMGIPPFGGFFSKYMVIAGALQAKQPVVALLFIVAAFLTVLYLFRLFNAVFMGEAKKTPAKESSVMMIASVVILAILSLAGGVFINYPADLVQSVVRGMLP